MNEKELEKDFLLESIFERCDLREKENIDHALKVCEYFRNKKEPLKKELKFRKYNSLNQPERLSERT